MSKRIPDDLVWQSRKHWMWWPWTFTKYLITEDRLMVESGIITTRYEEIYLYRLMDCKCSINLLQRLFGTGTVTIVGLDYTTPVLQITNIKNPFEVKEMLSKLIMENRRQSRIVEFSDGGF